MPNHPPSPTSPPPDPPPHQHDPTSILYVLPKVACACLSTMHIHPFVHNGSKPYAMFLTLLCSLTTYLQAGAPYQYPRASPCPMGCIAFHCVSACSDPINGRLGGFQFFALIDSTVGWTCFWPHVQV